MSKIALLAVLFTSLTFASQVRAQVSNGDLATGDLTGWQTLGAPTVVSSNSANTSMDVNAPVPAGYNNPTTLTGGNQVMISSTKEDTGLAISVSGTTLDAALGVTLPSTSGTDPFGTSGTFAPVNGQAIYQTFTVSAPVTLSFDFAFNTEDYHPYDQVGFVLDGVYTTLAVPDVYNGTNPPFQSQGYQTFTIDLGTGSHFLGFVAYNTGGHDASSNLYISNITPSASPLVDTPEPGTWALLIMGLGVLAVLRRLKKFV